MYTIGVACGEIRPWLNPIRHDNQGRVMKLKITAIADSAGVIVAKALLARLRLGKGNELHTLETPDGIKLTVSPRNLASQMEVAERVMRDHRALLHKLVQ